tara:strand:- start:444 stop:1223 length:780 start_codon:yes stop_codon:yes gene_type:complete
MFPSKKIQKNYVFKISELMLIYCFKKKKEKNFIDLINNDCDIYRKTDLYNIKKKNFLPKKKEVWKKITLKLQSFTNLKQEEFLKKSIEILRPHFLKRIKNNTKLVEYNTYAKFGCFNYSIKDRKVDLHMPVFQFIDHKRAKRKSYNHGQKFSMRAQDLFSLVKNVKKKHPKVKIIQMGSWLNEYKPFRNLFPKTWKSTNKIKKKNSIAWWGQFVDVTGNIHKKNAKFFIKNFKFPYSGKFYQCRIEDLNKFILSSLRKA